MFTITASDIVKERVSSMQLGILEADRIKVLEDDPEFDMHLRTLTVNLQERFPDKRPSSNSIVSHVRRMYRRIGWEPTQYRPSSEALVRRILKGKGLYRINNLVDYGNLVSAGYFLPLGLYDRTQIKGSIVVDVGRPDEYYDGIAREGIRAEGKMILRDEEGIFGNPTADSKRTSITPQTQSIMAVFFCPPEIEASYITHTLSALAGHYSRFTNSPIRKEIVVLGKG